MAGAGIYSDEADEPLITDINVTPLVDIVLVLLIVFMITMPVIVTLDAIKERELKASLAKVAEAVPLVSDPDEVEVTISADGRFLVRDQVLSRNELLQLFLSMEAANPGRAKIQVRPEGNSPWQDVAKVLELLQRANIRNYRFGASG